MLGLVSLVVAGMRRPRLVLNVIRGTRWQAWVTWSPRIRSAARR